MFRFINKSIGKKDYSLVLRKITLEALFKSYLALSSVSDYIPTPPLPNEFQFVT